MGFINKFLAKNPRNKKKARDYALTDEEKKYTNLEPDYLMFPKGEKEQVKYEDYRKKRGKHGVLDKEYKVFKEMLDNVPEEGYVLDNGEDSMIDPIMTGELKEVKLPFSPKSKEAKRLRNFPNNPLVQDSVRGGLIGNTTLLYRLGILERIDNLGFTPEEIQDVDQTVEKGIKLLGEENRLLFLADLTKQDIDKLWSRNTTGRDDYYKERFSKARTYRKDDFKKAIWIAKEVLERRKRALEQLLKEKPSKVEKIKRWDAPTGEFNDKGIQVRETRDKMIKIYDRILKDGGNPKEKGSMFDFLLSFIASKGFLVWTSDLPGPPGRDEETRNKYAKGEFDENINGSSETYGVYEAMHFRDHVWVVNRKGDYITGKGVKTENGKEFYDMGPLLIYFSPNTGLPYILTNYSKGRVTLWTNLVMNNKFSESMNPLIGDGKKAKKALFSGKFFTVGDPGKLGLAGKRKNLVSGNDFFLPLIEVTPDYLSKYVLGEYFRKAEKYGKRAAVGMNTFDKMTMKEGNYLLARKLGEEDKFELLKVAEERQSFLVKYYIKNKLNGTLPDGWEEKYEELLKLSYKMDKLFKEAHDRYFMHLESFIKWGKQAFLSYKAIKKISELDNANVTIKVLDNISRYFVHKNDNGNDLKEFLLLLKTDPVYVRTLFKSIDIEDYKKQLDKITLQRVEVKELKKMSIEAMKKMKEVVENWPAHNFNPFVMFEEARDIFYKIKQIFQDLGFYDYPDRVVPIVQGNSYDDQLTAVAKKRRSQPWYTILTIKEAFEAIENIMIKEQAVDPADMRYWELRLKFMEEFLPDFFDKKGETNIKFVVDENARKKVIKKNEKYRNYIQRMSVFTNGWKRFIAYPLLVTILLSMTSGGRETISQLFSNGIISGITNGLGYLLGVAIVATPYWIRAYNTTTDRGYASDRVAKDMLKKYIGRDNADRVWQLLEENKISEEIPNLREAILDEIKKMVAKVQGKVEKLSNDDIYYLPTHNPFQLDFKLWGQLRSTFFHIPTDWEIFNEYQKTEEWFKTPKQIAQEMLEKGEIDKIDQNVLDKLEKSRLLMNTEGRFKHKVKNNDISSNAGFIGKNSRKHTGDLIEDQLELHKPLLTRDDYWGYADNNLATEFLGKEMPDHDSYTTTPAGVYKKAQHYKDRKAEKDLPEPLRKYLDNKGDVYLGDYYEHEDNPESEFNKGITEYNISEIVRRYGDKDLLEFIKGIYKHTRYRIDYTLKYLNNLRKIYEGQEDKIKDIDYLIKHITRLVKGENNWVGILALQLFSPKGTPFYHYIYNTYKFREKLTGPGSIPYKTNGEYVLYYSLYDEFHKLNRAGIVANIPNHPARSEIFKYNIFSLAVPHLPNFMTTQGAVNTGDVSYVRRLVDKAISLGGLKAITDVFNPFDLDKVVLFKDKFPDEFYKAYKRYNEQLAKLHKLQFTNPKEFDLFNVPGVENYIKKVYDY